MGELGASALVEELTAWQLIGIISAGIAGLVAFIKGIEYLLGKLSEIASGWLLSALKPIDEKLNNLEKKLDSLDLDRCQDYIVGIFGEAERHPLEDSVKMRLHEDYDRYTTLGGNSYVHSEFDRLKKNGKI